MRKACKGSQSTRFGDFLKSVPVGSDRSRLWQRNSGTVSQSLWGNRGLLQLRKKLVFLICR